MNEIKVEVVMGTVELRSWFEPEIQANGDIRMVGKCCAIERRPDGSIRDVRFDSTGVSMSLR